MSSLKSKLFLVLSIIGLVLVADLVYYRKYINLFQSLQKMKKPLPPCPEISPLLVGIQPVKRQILTWRMMIQNQTHVIPRGHYKPPECKSSHRVAIIVPYRKRDAHLRLFINNIHPFLQRQQLDYWIFIIQQLEMAPFNRGMLMNIGFTEAQRIYNFTCFIFHDVDLIPENDQNPYNCIDSPRHLSVAIDVFKYRLPFKNIFGGVISMQANQFKKLNGFSNRFSGWGGEDDDLFNRVNKQKISIFRYSENISRYTMIKHVKQNPNPSRFRILKDHKYETDGLNSLNYVLDSIVERGLFTLISVYLNKSEGSSHFVSSFSHFTNWKAKEKKKKYGFS